MRTASEKILTEADDLRLRHPRFPRSSLYSPDWVFENNMGPNALWLTEWLAEIAPPAKGSRVLDMGCGKAMSSIFLAAEFEAEIWANDLWIPATENWRRVQEAGMQAAVHPIHAEAHSLPYADGFFDSIMSMDSYQYYGTDDLYMGYFHKFVKPGGEIGLVVPGLMKELPGGRVPEHLLRKQKSGGVFWQWDCWSIHTAEWWRALLSHYPFIRLEACEPMRDGGAVWLAWERALESWPGKKMFPSDAECLEADAGEYLTFVRMLVRRVE